MVFQGWEGMEKLEVKAYVVLNLRCKVTERLFSKLSRKLRLLQKILVR